MHALTPHTRIDKYKILHKLGNGGFGVTYVARDCELERTVVLKECFPATLCCRDENGNVRPLREELAENYLLAMADMTREVRTLAKLRHANIVPVYNVLKANGALFYEMLFLEGGSLKELLEDTLADGDSIAPEKAREWLLVLLDALSYLHSKGLVHRDIKPSNIMFDEDDAPVIIDFGAAVHFDVNTITQGDFTEIYAAPEQIANDSKRVGPHTDLYSLAATFYEVLSGRQPEPTPKRLYRDELEPLEEVPGYPGLAESIMRNLSLRAEQRCANAAEWKALLLAAPVAEVLPDEPVQPLDMEESVTPEEHGGEEEQAIEPDSRGEKQRAARARRKKRRKSRSWPWGVLLVALSAGGFWYTANDGEKPARPKVTPPVVQKPEVDIDSFYKDYCARTKPEVYVKKMERCCEQVDAAYKEYEKAISREVAILRADLTSISREGARWEYLEKEGEKLSEMDKTFMDKWESLLEQFNEAESRLSDICRKPRSHIKELSKEQQALLPALEQRMVDEFLESGTTKHLFPPNFLGGEALVELTRELL